MTADSTLAGYLEEATRLWPGRPARRVGTRDAAPVTGSYRLAAVPTPRTARLLVPGGSPRAAAGSLLRFSSALGPREVATRVGLAAVLRSGLAARLPGIEVAEGPRSLRTHLADVLGEEVEVSFGLGSARANRKPVLEVFDRRGRRLAFVKVGTTPVSAALVQGEAEALRRLAEVDLGDSLVVPRLISLASWEGLSVLVMTVLPSRVPRPGSDVEVPHAEIRALTDAFPADAGPLDRTDWWARIAASTTRTDPAATRTAAALESLRVLDARLDEPLGLGAWHGDWTSWNQSRTRSRLAVWDWERFEVGVPLGLDACHFGVNAATRRNGASPAAVHAGLRAAGLEPGRDVDVRVASAYLLSIAARYLDDLEHATGAASTVLESRISAVIEVTESWQGGRTTRMGA